MEIRKTYRKRENHDRALERYCAMLGSENYCRPPKRRFPSEKPMTALLGSVYMDAVKPIYSHISDRNDTLVTSANEIAIGCSHATQQSAYFSMGIVLLAWWQCPAKKMWKCFEFTFGQSKLRRGRGMAPPLPL
jgi:hypothetical protein